jgi:hypothetical protein
MKKLFGCLILCGIGFGGCVLTVSSCAKAVHETAEAEAKRLASLTPAQREAEALKTRLDGLDSHAANIAEDYLRDYLKHPKDAEFPWGSPRVSHTPTGPGVEEFLVVSTVKAKNDFGAALTHEWRARLSHSNNTFSLLYCEIDGKAVFVSQQAVDALEKKSADQRQQAALDAAEEAAQQKEAARQHRIDDANRKIAEAAHHRPETAANMLSNARTLRANGDEAAYQKWIARVAAEYPETDAGREAASLLAKPSSPRRKWIDAAGTHSVEAELVDFDGQRATLRKADGKIITLDAAKLSEADRRFLSGSTKE